MSDNLKVIFNCIDSFIPYKKFKIKKRQANFRK